MHYGLNNDYVKNTTEINNKKKLFSFLKSKKTDITGVSPLEHKETMYTNDVDIAKILNEQFTSVFSNDDGSTPEIFGTKGTEMSKLIVTRNGIVKLLNELNPTKQKKWPR